MRNSVKRKLGVDIMTANKIKTIIDKHIEYGRGNYKVIDMAPGNHK